MADRFLAPGLSGHNNGIIVGDPVWPEVGAYVRQCILRVPKGTHLPWYWTPPSDRSARLPPLYRGLAAGTIFGPVHQVEDTLDKEGFISVLVPPPLCKVPREDRETLPDLVWINIFTNKRKGRKVSHHYCRVVADKEVDMWRRLGWKDVWIDQPNLIMRPLDAPPLAPSSASADQGLIPLPAPAPCVLDREPGKAQAEWTIDSLRGGTRVRQRWQSTLEKCRKNHLSCGSGEGLEWGGPGDGHGRSIQALALDRPRIPGGWTNPASRALWSRAEQSEYDRGVAELQQAHQNDASDGDDHNEPASSSGAC